MKKPVAPPEKSAREYSPKNILRAAPDAAAFTPDFLDNVVLIYGPRKSGTTLLQSLLDGGSQLLMLPGEAKIKFLFRPQRGNPYLLRYALKSGDTDFTFVRAQTGATPTFSAADAPHFPGLSPDESAQLFDAPRYFQTLQKLSEALPNGVYARTARGETVPLPSQDLREELRAEIAAFAACLNAREYSREQTTQNETTAKAEKPAADARGANSQLGADSQHNADTKETREYSQSQSEAAPTPTAQHTKHPAENERYEYSRDAAAAHFRGFAVKEVGSDPRVVIARWREVFPRARVAFLVRDPRFVARSIALDRRRKGVHLGFAKTWRECEEALHIVAGAARAKENCAVLCYEDLTRDTRGEMQRLCAALDISFEEKLCAPTMLGRSAVVRTASQKTAGVFRVQKNWSDDLLPSQRFAIVLCCALAPLLFALQRRPFVHYDVLQKSLQARRTAEK